MIHTPPPQGRVKRWLLSPTITRTAWASAWQFERLACQVVVLILLARALGPADYGIFAGSAGLATALAGLVGLGTGMLLVKDVASHPERWDAAWRRALSLTLLSGLALTACFTALAPRLLDIQADISTMLYIGAADLLFFPLIYLSSFAFQAFHRIGMAAAMPSAIWTVRMAGALLFLAGPSRSLASYALYHTTSSALAALTAIALVHVHLKPHKPAGHAGLASMGESLRFCLTWFTGNALGEFDKTLAVRFGEAGAAASYAIAYRLGSALATPVTALVMGAQPRLFAMHHIERGRLAATIMAMTLALGILAAAGSVVAAPLLPYLLGNAYADVRHVAVLMAFFPMAFSIRFVIGSLLTSEGRPGLRALYEATGVIVMSLLGAILIPRWGVKGMIGMIAGAESTVLLLGGITLLRLRQHPEASKAAPSDPDQA